MDPNAPIQGPARPLSPAQFANNGFSYRQKLNADGSVGIDYFDANGKPITNTQFATATGANTNLLEHASTVGVPMAPKTTLSADFNTAVSGQPTGAGAASTTIPPLYRNIGTDQYDLSTPEGRVNYFNAANSLLDTNQAQTVRSYGESAGALDLAKTNLGTSRSNYFRNLDKQGVGLNQSYDLGQVQRGQNFAAMGPSAFQSSQATSDDFANKQRLKGVADLQEAGAQAGTGFDQQGNQIDQQKADMSLNYTGDLNKIAEQRGALAANLDTYDARQGVVDPSKYSISPTQAYQAPTVDLSPYLQYTNFGGASGSPSAVGANKFAFAPTSSLTPQDSYFGYTPNGADKSNITNYFRTGNING